MALPTGQMLSNLFYFGGEEIWEVSSVVSQQLLGELKMMMPENGFALWADFR